MISHGIHRPARRVIAPRATEVACTLLALVCMPSCAHTPVPLGDDPKLYEIKWFSIMDHNEYGLPVLAGPLNPSEINRRTGAVAAVYDRARSVPVKAYHIAIVPSSERPDPRRPFKVIYEWTGRGFRVGHEYSKGIIEQSAALAGDVGRGGGAGDGSCLALIAAPGSAAGAVIFLGSGVGGFAVGLAESVPAAYREIEKIGPGKAQVFMGYSSLEYDSRGRIVCHTEYSPPPRSEKLLRTLFFYEGNDALPLKVSSYSWPEKKERIVYRRKS